MAVIRSKDKRPSRDEGKSEAQMRAQAIIDEAKAAGEALLEQTREELASQSADAHEQGLLEGAQEAEHLRQEIDGLKQRMVKEIEGEVVRSSLRVAEELLELELKERPEAMVDLVCAALSSARNARDIFLRVNPKDAEILRAHKSRIIDVLGRARDVDVREDRKVGRGGVLIQTESGVIDAQLQTQLEEISTVWGN